MENDLKYHAGFIYADELNPINGETIPDAERDFSVLLFCKRCGCLTRMQMISLNCAVCETCREIVIPH